MKTNGVRSRNRVAKAAPDMMELGRTGLEQYGGRIDDEILYQLKGDKRIKTFREMSENDAVLGAMLYAIEILIRGMDWTVEPGGDSASEQEAAEYLDSILVDMSHSMADFVSEWMATPAYGFCPFEIVYKVRQGASREPGQASRYSDGKIGVRKLAVRHPTTVDRWVFDESGGIQSLVQLPQFGKGAVELPIEKLLLFRMMARKNSPEGTSLLRRAYVPWFRKKRIETIEAIGIERDLNGLPVMYTPAEWHVSGGKYSAMLAEAEKIVRNIRNDEQAGAVLPNIYDEAGNKLLELTLLSTAGRRNFDTNAVVQRLAREMLMVALADVIVLGHEKVGSFALASSKTNMFAAGIGAMADDIETVLNRHLVPRLLALNGMPIDDRMPQYRHGDVESIDLMELADYIQKLSMAGFPLFPTESGELERDLLRAANLPADEIGQPKPIIQPDEAEDPEGAVEEAED